MYEPDRFGSVLDMERPRDERAALGIDTSRCGPGPIVRQWRSCWGIRMEFVGLKVACIPGSESKSFGTKNPPLRRWRIRLPCAKALPISLEGAWRLLWILFARMTALKDSKASVAKRMAGPKRRIWEGRWMKIWNFGLLNHWLVQRAVLSRKASISLSRIRC